LPRRISPGHTAPMLGRVFSLVAALLLASASAQANVPARSIAHRGELASPSKTAPREIFSPVATASGKNPLASVCRVGGIWHPPLNLASCVGYTGYYADPESSLYYAQQRYYSPKLGRFTRIDPWAGDVLNPITLNKYLYANGNPLGFLDPTGTYGEAGHYYTTYYVALRVGYTDSEAHQLAIYSQLPDEAASLDAVVMQTRAVFGDEHAQKNRDAIQIGLHTLSGANAKFETNRTLNAIARAGDDLTTTGLLIHRLGDTFAHRRTSEYGGESDPAKVRMFDTGVGHGVPWFAPDVIQRRPELYLEYAQTLTDALGKKRGLTAQQLAKLQESVREELRDDAYSEGALPPGGFATRDEDLRLKARSVIAVSSEVNKVGIRRIGTGREPKGFVENEYRPENFESDSGSLAGLEEKTGKSLVTALNEILGSSESARANRDAYTAGEATRGVNRASSLLGGARMGSDSRGEPAVIKETPDATTPSTVWQRVAQWWEKLDE